jgi:hypothetical protein
MGDVSIPAELAKFDIYGVVADIMITFLGMIQERQGPHPFKLIMK